MVDALSDKGACETPMSDHVSRFYNLLRDEYVHIRVDIRRTMGDGTTYFDGSSFSNDVAKAISDAVAEREAEPVAWRWKPKGHVVWIYNPDPEWLAAQSSDEIDAEQLFISLPTSELEVLRKRVTELEKSEDDAYRIIGKLEAHAINDIMYDGRDVAAWCADYAARRVREGGKVG